MKTMSKYHLDYVRYMDDGLVISESKEALQSVLDDIIKMSEENGLVINRKKTQIVKLSRGFTFLKARFIVTKTGRIVKRIPRNSITRERQKLKKLGRKLKEGKIDKQKVVESYASWRGYAMNFDSRRTLKNMDALFNSIMQ